MMHGKRFFMYGVCYGFDNAHFLMISTYRHAMFEARLAYTVNKTIQITLPFTLRTTELKTF